MEDCTQPLYSCPSVLRSVASSASMILPTCSSSSSQIVMSNSALSLCACTSSCDSPAATRISCSP
eukprot:5194567-Pyramimonas_sp.AAC.1